MNLINLNFTLHLIAGCFVIVVINNIHISYKIHTNMYPLYIIIIICDAATAVTS